MSLGRTLQDNPLLALRWSLALTAIALTLIVSFLCPFYKQGIASWYSEDDPKKYVPNKHMANGEVFNDEELICASWDYDFGQVLLVTNMANNKSVQVVVKDRGPNRRLYNQGRIIDLSKGAFRRIANLSKGLVSVKVRRIK